MRVRRRLTVVLLSALGLLGLGGAALVLHERHPLPAGVPGPAADELAHAIERAVHLDAWERTGAVRWTFGGRNQHLWDRRRMLSRVRSGGDEVLVNLTTHAGRAFRGGAEVPGEEGRRLVARAYAAWINDSFWLNPLGKLYDAGVSRLLARTEDGRPALLLRYGGGGLTPGDSYLWITGPAPGDPPRAWRMWVSVIPVGGVEASWEGWVPLATSALIATDHRIAGLHLRLTDVAGAATLAELEPGPDPFARLQ